MVLARILVATLLLAGCKQSLFDNGGGGGDDGSVDGNMGDGAVQSSCGSNCLGDAAADFCGTKWQCLDDHRDRTWAAMTASGMAYVGATASNKIAKGTDSLLVSTAGMSDMSDPAIAFTSTSKQVIKLSISVDVPAGAGDHIVRLYRNSREDVLFTGLGNPGGNVATSITVDAFNGDRFLLALAPTGSGGANLKVKFFVNGTGMLFPKECQLGIQFESAMGQGVPNACGADVSFLHDDGGNTSSGATPVFAAGPFPELGQAASINFDYFFEGAAALDRSGDTTTQFWFKHRSYTTTGGPCMYSDQNCDNPAGGGLNIYGDYNGGMIGYQTCTGVGTVDFRDVSYPNEGEWHFLRVVHAGGNLALCIDGAKVTSFAVAAGKLATPTPPYLAKNVDYSPNGAFVDAAMDDVRVLSTALPCN